MGEGPTTVGSIVGQLKLDDSDLNTRLDAAEARAKEFEANSPTIKVKASVADAIAALDAVNAAEKKLQATNAASDAATQRAILAQMRLNDVQTARGRTDYQVAAAEFALQQATEKSDAAAEKAIAADDSLTAARAKLLAVTDALAAGEGAENDEEKRGNDIKNTGFSRITAIVAAVAALIPLLGPLAAYTAAASGGLAGLGLVGVLAIVGIKQAMKDGNAVGDQYSLVIQSLKSDLAELAQTAAVGTLGGFNSIVNDLNDAMPQLRSEVSGFAGILGGTANAALTGGITALRILNPLFVQAGMYVGELALDFEKWASGNGIQKFASYAEQALPQVANLLGNLATSALNIVEALAPAGSAMVTFLNILANVLDFLSGFGPGFAIVVGGATAAYAAFKLFGSITPLIQAVTEAVTGLGIAEQASLGPIGLVVAGVTALVAVLMISDAASQQAADGVDTYAAAVQADNGVIGENVKLQAAKNLQDAGAIDNASKLGIKTNDLVKAALGNNTAMKSVNQTLDDQSKKYAQLNSTDSPTFIARSQGLSASQRALKATVSDTATSLTTQQGAIKAAIKSYNDLERSVGGTTISTQAQLQAQQDLADEYGVSLSAYEAAIAGNKKTAAQAAATTLSLQTENDAATLLNNAFTLLNGGSLDVATAQTGLAAANNSLTDSFKQNGKVVDGSTKGAVANQQAIQAQVQAAQAAAEAIGKQTKSTVAGEQAYAASKLAIENTLKAQGDLTSGVQAYIDQLYDVKNFKPTTTTFDANTSSAAKKLAALQAQFNALETTKTVKVDGSGAVTIHWANGVEAHAAGGTIGGAGTSTSDSNLVRMSRGEEVIKASSAGQARPFLKAFNANPSKALSAVASSSAAPISVHITGAGLADVISVAIEQDGQWQALHAAAGVSR